MKTNPKRSKIPLAWTNRLGRCRFRRSGQKRMVHVANSLDTEFDEAQTTDDLVDAELVPDPPNPFSFGMKALLGLVAISAVQLALMSDLGPLVGLLVGIGLCVVAMSVLMISSVILGLRPGEQLLEKLDRIAIRLVVGIVVLFFGTIVAGGGQLIYLAMEDARFHWRMQSDLGITYATKTVYNFPGDGTHQVLELTSVTADGPFDKAGLQKGDLILLDETSNNFLQKLDGLRGQSIDIPVANYKASSGKTEVDDTTKRTVTVQLPE